MYVITMDSHMINLNLAVPFGASVVMISVVGMLAGVVSTGKGELEVVERKTVLSIAMASSLFRPQ